MTANGLRRAGGLLALSASAYAFQLLAARELAVSFVSVWPLLLLMICLAQIGFGIGAYWNQRSPSALRPRGAAALLGACVLLSLLGMLRLAPASLPAVWCLWSFLFLLASFVLFGRLYLSSFLENTGEAGNPVAAAVVCTIAGTAAGFLAAGWASVSLGVNVSLLILGLSLLLAARNPWRLALAPALLAAFAHPLDQALENLRPAGIDCNARCSGEILGSEFERIYGGWTPYSRLDIFANESRSNIVGAYNKYVYWGWKSDSPFHSPELLFLRPNDNILVIGASAGFDAVLFPKNVDTRRTTLIEIDPTVVNYFLRNPELNQGQFSKSRYAVMDGRSYLDGHRGPPFDAILIGSMDSPSKGFFRNSPLKASVLTLEGVKAAFSRLSGHGILFFTPRDEPTAMNVMNILRTLDVPWGMLWRVNLPYAVFEKSNRPILIDQKFVEYDIYASLDGARLKNFLEDLRRALRKIPTQHAPFRGPRNPGNLDYLRWRYFYGWAVLPGDRIARDLRSSEPDFMTDDRPYLISLDPGFKPIAALVLIAASLVLCACALGSRLRLGRRYPFFLAIGIGFTLTQMLLLSKWRSCFGDPVSTTFVVFLFWTAGSALGARLSKRRGMSREAAWALLAAGAAYTYWGLGHIPFSAHSSAQKLLVCALLVTPAAAGCGVFLPWGLAAIPESGFGAAFLLDGLGAAGGYVLFQGVAMIWGVGWVLPAAAAAYGAALCCLKR